MGRVYWISGWGCGIEETEKQKSRITGKMPGVKMMGMMKGKMQAAMVD